ncbi:MAG TPA: precorrin-6A reductase [Patescibacteria group bacterium]|nr:precorrin-6A reductase [Patescibacteria group bacterium]
MIWIIGGTSETKSLIRSLAAKKEYIVSVATYSGAEMLTDENIMIGRMNQQAMLQFIRVHDIDTVVDMSHPYALEVTKNAKAACNATNIKYVRYNRKASGVNDCIYVDSIDACAELLKEIKGCVFFTTGIKNIKDFEKVKGKNCFVYRVLPSVFSIQECVDNKVKMEDIVAILGPVSEAMNYTMFKEFKADYVIMKDSGKEGGTLEKIQACKRLGIMPVVIGRQASEAGVESIEELLRVLL